LVATKVIFEEGGQAGAVDAVAVEDSPYAVGEAARNLGAGEGFIDGFMEKLSQLEELIVDSLGDEDAALEIELVEILGVLLGPLARLVLVTDLFGLLSGADPCGRPVVCGTRRAAG
jgi:hypothetical protein